MSKVVDGRELDQAQAKVRQGGAYTQTYSTAARTVPAAVSDLSAATSISATTSSSKLDAVTATIDNAIVNKNMHSIQTQLASQNADTLALKKAINALIDDLQAGGLAS